MAERGFPALRHRLELPEVAMTEGFPWRRLRPPPHRRPGPLTVLVWWRIELLIAAVLAELWHVAGISGLTSGAAVLLLAVAVPTRRLGGASLWQLLAVPHRVRSAFVQAGVATRQGRLPWIFWALPAADAVRVRVGLQSGITTEDLEDAIPIIVTACGAARAEVVRGTKRPHRATIVVTGPRRGVL